MSSSTQTPIYTTPLEQLVRTRIEEKRENRTVGAQVGRSELTMAVIAWFEVELGVSLTPGLTLRLIGADLDMFHVEIHLGPGALVRSEHCYRYSGGGMGAASQIRWIGISTQYGRGLFGDFVDAAAFAMAGVR